jgi:short-subunit dehydrogenase
MKNSAAWQGIGWTMLGAGCVGIATAMVRRYRRCDFQNKNVLITGGSRGLGLLLARRLVAMGARVAICARDEQELAAALTELEKGNSQVVSIACDVTDRSSVDEMIRTIQSRWGHLDVLINNAGAIVVGPQQQMTLDDYEHAMNVHYWAALYTILAVLPQMRRRRSGRIVNISSIGGVISVPHLLPYSASKFALLGLSEGLRSELLQDGIYVTTVCPGLMRTGSAIQAHFKGQTEAEYAWFSVSASTPGIAMSADRAADQIIAACRDGRARVELSLPAKLAARIHGMAPGWTVDALGVANRFLPSTVPHRQPPVQGKSIRPAWLPGWLTYFGEKAAVRNNEQL